MTKPPKRAKAKTARPRKSPAARSRSFEEVVAVNLKDPFHAARIAGLESGERAQRDERPRADARRGEGEVSGGLDEG